MIGAVALVGGGVWYFASSGESRSAALPAEPSRPEPPTGMVFVPGGEFKMGSNSGDEHSRPEHYVTVGPFFMDITEVTNEAYKQFVDAAGYKAPPQWKDGTFPPDKERFPVTGVTWHDAVAYAQWAGKRLPTEQEWELAARGTDGRLYPWGAKWDTKMANAAGASRGLREVGQGGTSPFGLYDMSGNAWEWTASEAKAYPGGQDPKSKLQLKVIRGGYFGSTASDATAVKRAYWGATGEADYGNTTIRCAKDIN